eukprot:scaffold296896_cov17-Tisochrysis_lutea.AAC.1
MSLHDATVPPCRDRMLALCSGTVLKNPRTVYTHHYHRHAEEALPSTTTSWATTLSCVRMQHRCVPSRCVLAPFCSSQEAPSSGRFHAALTLLRGPGGAACWWQH